jgi:hypothetical protein
MHGYCADRKACAVRNTATGAGVAGAVPLAIMPPPGSETLQGLAAPQGPTSLQGAPPTQGGTPTQGLPPGQGLAHSQGLTPLQGLAPGQGLGNLPVGSFYPMQPGMYQHILGAPAAITPSLAPGYVPNPVLLFEGRRTARPAFLLNSVRARSSQCTLSQYLVEDSERDDFLFRGGCQVRSPHWCDYYHRSTSSCSLVCPEWGA